MKNYVKGLFVIAALTISNSACYAQVRKSVTLSNIYEEYLFAPEYIAGLRSLADGNNYTVLKDQQAIVSYNYATGKKNEVLFDNTELPNSPFTSVEEYELSADESKVLIVTQRVPVYRHSFLADYWIYDRSGKTLTALDINEKQQLATFSPDGTKVAFVRHNNLYYKDLTTDELIQVTSDGQYNTIINGAPDWVYEEEFGFTQGYCWSPDSRFIAYYRFDESMVRQFDMTVFEGLYPANYRFKYPKAGEDNSKVSIHVYNLSKGQTAMMDSGNDPQRYIPRIKWSATPGQLCIIQLNRLQNKVEVSLADASSGKTTTIYTEENEKYISRIDDHYIHFTKDQKYFIILSERSGYYHYYRYALNGELVNPVTQGEWEVQEFLGMDDKNEMLYYRSNELSVIQSDVFAATFNGTKTRQLSPQQGYNTADFSADFTYYINTYSNANTPPQYSVHTNKGKMIRVIEENAGLKNEIKSFNFSKKELITIPVADNIELNAYLIKPPDFDSTKKYPLFISVYGGPESQDVTDSWDSQMAWDQLLAQHGIIIACVDNRGTDGRGEAFRKSTYLELGKLETEDQINAAIYLGNKPWIDENRIGIWGWSYGGYMTLLCMTKGADVFKTGVAVGSVTDWRFYDTIYTERYMRTPQENPDGYDENSPLNHAGKLKGKLLLIHGTADDNVHLQNSVEMARVLINENKQFDMFFYPDKAHSISGGITRYHLFTMITNYVLENL